MTVLRRAAEIEPGSILASRHAAEKNMRFAAPLCVATYCERFAASRGSRR